MRAYIGGTFDILHPGHVCLFRFAKEHFGHVTVSLNTDEFTTRFKRPPALPLEERMAMVAAIRYVDDVAVNIGNEDSRPAILLACATHVVHGDDWSSDKILVQMGLSKPWLEEHGITMVSFPRVPNLSTTRVVARVRGDAK